MWKNLGTIFFLFSFLFLALEGRSLEVETSTSFKLLVPPQSEVNNSSNNQTAAFDDDEDDAVIIDADSPSGPLEDLTPSTFDPTLHCSLPPLKGPCRAVIDAWYFDKESQSCTLFQWSGCGGNENRFKEKQFCQNHCQKNETIVKTSIKVNVCPKLEVEGCGLLKCGVSKDPQTGCEKCDCNLEKEKEKEKIGSVSGNPEAVLDDDKIAEIKPVGKPEEVCKLPETRGNCRAMMTRWRYDPELKECVQFHFGGCGSNPNNFVSKEKCQEFCRGQ